MTLHRDIPSFLKIGPYLLRVFYLEQPKVCWKCSSPEHIGRDCPDSYCFNCDQSGHLAADCPEYIRCSLCKSENHLAVDCDGNWGRRTLAQRTPARNEDPPEQEVEITNQNVENDDADGSETMDEGDVHAASESSEAKDSAEESDADLDSNIEDSQDEIQSFSSTEPAEVCESIEQFSSAEPPSKQRKRESISDSHDQKRSKTDENPP